MKLAISSKGNNLDREIDPRFGRAGYFLIGGSGNYGFRGH